MQALLDALVRLRSRSASPPPTHFSLIDFGTDTVKAVVIQREKAGVRVLGYGFAPAEGRDLAGARAEVVVLAAAADTALTAAEDQSERPGPRPKVVPDEAVVLMPARLTRGESFTVRQTRPNPGAPIAARELKGAWERVERLARERLPLLGDDPGAWKPLAITPGAVTVDGHQVTDPVGLKGRELALSAFGVAVWPPALRAVETIAERLELKLANLVAAPQALAGVVPQRDAILVEVGARGTSLHLIRHDALVAAAWWPQGGDFFTQGLARAFRCPQDEAEALKRAYADGALSESDRELVTQRLHEPVAGWLETLRDKLQHMAAHDVYLPAQACLSANGAGALPGRMYVTGGGSLLPDLPAALLSLEAPPPFSFRRSLEVERLGARLGARAPGLPALIDVPPHPVCELLAPAISLAACLE
jgi:cell division ATPase FtsA